VQSATSLRVYLENSH